MKNQEMFIQAMKEADSMYDIGCIAVDIASSTTRNPFMTETCFLISALLYMKTLYEKDRLTLPSLIQLLQEADINENDCYCESPFDKKMFEVEKIIGMDEPSKQEYITVEDNAGNPLKFKTEYIYSMLNYYKAFRANPSAKKIASWAYMDTMIFYNDLNGLFDRGSCISERYIKNIKNRDALNDPVGSTATTADLAMQMLESFGAEKDSDAEQIKDAVESKFENVTGIDTDKLKVNKKLEE